MSIKLAGWVVPGGDTVAVRDSLLAQGVRAERISLEKPVETMGGASVAKARRVEVMVK